MNDRRRSWVSSAAGATSANVVGVGQLRWQCRRGMLELDYVLERYLDNHYDAADDAERSLFRELLTAQDPELQVWLLNGVVHPDPAYRSLISRIRGI